MDISTGWPSLISIHGYIHGNPDFFTKGDNIKSCQKDDKSPLKWAWFCSRDPFLCTAVELETFLLATRRAAINNVAPDGLLLMARTALEATHVARQGLGLNSIGSICHRFVANLIV